MVEGDRSFSSDQSAIESSRSIYDGCYTRCAPQRKIQCIDLTKYQLEKSTAFPCPISLAATWNLELSYQYAEA